MIQKWNLPKTFIMGKMKVLYEKDDSYMDVFIEGSIGVTPLRKGVIVIPGAKRI